MASINSIRMRYPLIHLILIALSESNEEVTLLKDDCTVMCWKPMSDYGSSGLNAEMLEYREVTEGKKLYYQGSDQK